jgi:sterol desaturase/sphingolipid hydroxylase (fatty acid hydroxylase superfamily)
MSINPIAIAIPIFMVLIIIEWLVANRQRLRVYRFADAITDLSCGVSSQITGVFLHAALVAPYWWIYDNARFMTLDSTWWGTHLIALFVLDFAYYWWHRWTHEMNLGWMSHVVHHQSEEYNLAVALRQSITSPISIWPFYIPMAFLGIHPLVYVGHSALNTLYQFWIHTETIGKLGPIGWVFNTPSHHRVHHGINPSYIDKNYAGVFILWDKMFGTFEPEAEEVVYGTVKPLASYNVFWANLWYAVLLFKDFRAATSLRDKFKVWFAHPGWRPEGLPAYPKPEPISREEQRKYDPKVSPKTALYVGLQFIPVSVALVFFLWFDSTATWSILGAVAGPILMANLAWGGLFERKSWALPLEVTRLLVSGALLAGACWAFQAPLVPCLLAILATLAGSLVALMHLAKTDLRVEASPAA